MTAFHRLRLLARRSPSLFWLWLLAYACTPLAQAVQAPQRWVAVPYCSVATPAAGAAAVAQPHAHAHLLLQVGDPGGLSAQGPALPHGGGTALPVPAARAGLAIRAQARVEPAPAHLHPPSRAPPTSPALA